MSRGGPVPEVAHLTSVKVDGISAHQDEVVGVKEELREKFGKFGEIGDVYIPRDRNFAFVRFSDKGDAQDAVDAMDGKTIAGREISVSMSMQAKKMPDEYPDKGRGDKGRGGGRDRSRERRRRDDSRDKDRRRRRDESRSRRRRDDDSRSRSRDRRRR
mmetsp:Transcript_16457/g.57528  ORF Transcript_16457/g.57528 Transcript_16457/m.57528 type:complete len:158 (-) Transcript_16457:151-624(-)